MCKDVFFFFLLDFNVCFYTNPPTQNFVHVLMWRVLLILPSIINVVKLISFNSPYCTSLLTIRVCLCHHALFLCMNVCVCVHFVGMCAYGCTVVRKTVWTIGCQCDLWMISLSVLILEQGELSLVLEPTLSHLTVECSSPLWHDTRAGLVQKPMKSDQSQHRFWFPVSSAAIFRPAGYIAAGIGAPANPSALSNFADSSCYAVQFSQHF